MFAPVSLHYTRERLDPTFRSISFSNVTLLRVLVHLYNERNIANGIVEIFSTLHDMDTFSRMPLTIALSSPDSITRHDSLGRDGLTKFPS